MSNRRSPVLRAWAIVLAGLATSLAEASQYPFRPVATGAVFKRQNGCLADYYSCASQGAVFSNICCMNGQICSLDAANNPACCPAGAVCTGTAPGTFVTPTATTTAVSYVPNPYFSYPYMATSFANSGDCLSAVSQCSDNYAACTSGLEGLGGSAYGVTIVVPGGGGITVSPSQTTVGTSSALSICSSLSSVACSGFQSSQCSTYGTASNGFIVGNSVPSRPTGNCQLAGALAAGIGLGILGGL